MAEHDSVIPAGGSGTLVAKVHTKPHEHGKAVKAVDVVFDVPGARALTLTLAYEAAPRIVAEPQARVWAVVVQGEEGRDRVTLRRVDGLPLVLSEPRIEPRGPAEVQLRPLAPQREDTVEVELIVPKGAPLGTYTGRLVLTTNHPEQPVYELPLAAKVKPRFALVPTQVMVWRAAAARSPLRVRVSHGNGTPWRIGGVEATPTGMMRVKRLSEGAAVDHVLEVEILGDADQAGWEGEIRLDTDDPVQGRVIIPVIVR